jgi:hypothetical protein
VSRDAVSGEDRTDLRSRDSAAVASMGGVVAVHTNPTSWYNNASFVLPLAVAMVAGLVGLITRRGEVLGFAAFLFAVTLGMVPVVLASWRHTATAVVLDQVGVTSLHEGKVLKSLRWQDVNAIERRETQGNVRRVIVTRSGDRLSLDGELEGLDGLIETAHRLAGLP